MLHFYGQAPLTMQFVHPTQPVQPGSNQLPTSKPLPVLAGVEAAKRLAAFAAVDRHISRKDKVCTLGVCPPAPTRLNSSQLIGIGSGSTVPYVVDRIVAQGAEANAGRIFVPTGEYIL